MQMSVQLHTAAALKWTAAQENTLGKDYPFRDHSSADPAILIQRTYLHFLWLPQSIMPLSLFVPSLLRIRLPFHPTEDQPHPFHAFIEPLLLSLRAASNKYHNELPQILADGGGAGEAEETMMWYVLGYEKTDSSPHGGEHLNKEDTVMLEDKWRSAWLERMEQREVQVQILLYLLKLSLPGQCTPLLPVELPHTGSISFIPPVKPTRLRKRKKEDLNMIIPSSVERLESFMDKLSTWQLVSLADTSRTETSQRTGPKNERDWMQKFCEEVVEPLFKSKLPEQCTLLRSKLFPNSPFSDVPPSPEPSTGQHLSSSRLHHSSSRQKVGSQSVAITDALTRSRSLSVSLAEEKERGRTATAGVVQGKTLQRALTRQISMSRVWKGKERPATAVSQTDAKAAATAKSAIGRTNSQSQSYQPCAALEVTLVAATPVKKLPPRAKSNASARSSSPSIHTSGRNSSPHLTGRSSSPPTACSSSITALDTDNDSPNGVRDRDEDMDEELWLPNSSPDVLLLGPSGWGTASRKRVSSASSEVVSSDTPVRKRTKLGR